MQYYCDNLNNPPCKLQNNNMSNRYTNKSITAQSLHDNTTYKIKIYILIKKQTPHTLYLILNIPKINL